MGAFIMVEQDPDAELDYTISWEQWLAGGTLTPGNSGFTADVHIDIVSQNVTPEGLCTVRIKAAPSAELETVYEVVNFVERDNGEKDNRTMMVTIREK